MDQLWWFLGGAALSIPLNILANLLMPFTMRVISGSRESARKRTLTSRLNRFARLKDYHSGRRDKYFYAIKTAAFLSSYYFISVIFVILLLDALGEASFSTYIAEGKYLRMVFIATGGVLVIFTWLMATTTQVRMITDLHYLDNFENIRADLVAEVGDEASFETQVDELSRRYWRKSISLQAPSPTSGQSA